MTDQEARQVRLDYDDGATITNLARLYGASRATISTS